MKRSIILLPLLATTACTQPPAQVSFRGSENFSQPGQHVSYYDGRSDSTRAPIVSQPAPVSYGNNTSYRPAPVVSQATQQTAPVSSISSNDIPPPSGVKAAAPVATSEAKPVEIKSVNGWTKKPRDEAAEIARRETGSETAWSATANDKPVATVTNAKFIWPVDSHDVASSFGSKGSGKANDGINIAAKKGDPVWAASDGEVVYASNGLKGYGNMVLIKHTGGKTTTYAHLSRMSVEKYDRVKQGDIIGYVGQTGNVKSPQLHFAVRDGNDAVDPQKYLNQAVASK